MKLPIAAVVLLMAAPALGLDYPCPSDPGFCYFDVGNDGCFDAGTDTGPIDSQLEAGDFPNPLPPGIDLPTDPGSIICPPTVTSLTPTANADWRTALGGHVRLHAVRFFKPKGLSSVLNVLIHSGGEIYIGGEIKQNRALSIWLDAQDDIEIDASMKSLTLTVESSAGAVLVRSKTKIKSSDSVLVTAPGDIVLEDRVSVRGGALSIWAAGDRTMTNPKVKSSFSLQLKGASIRSFGKSKLGSGRFISSSCPAIIESDAGGMIWFDQMSFSGGGQLCITGGSVRIGDDRRRSKIRVKPNDSQPQEIVLSAGGAVDLDRVTMISPVVDISTSGTQVDITNGTLKGSPTGTTTLTSGVGSTCDLSGTVLKKMTLTEDCGTLIGP